MEELEKLYSSKLGCTVTFRRIQYFNESMSMVNQYFEIQCNSKSSRYLTLLSYYFTLVELYSKVVI